MGCRMQATCHQLDNIVCSSIALSSCTHHLPFALRFRRDLPRDYEEENQRHGEHVRLEGGRESLLLLRTHPCLCSRDLRAALRSLKTILDFGKAEVNDLRRALAVEHDVLRLDVAVDDAL